MLAGSCLLVAQSFTGAVIGTVTDPSGAAVAKAQLKAVEVPSNVATESGVYRLEAEAAGFRCPVHPNVEVHVADRLELNLAMVLGGVSESVEVSGAAPLVESQSGAVGNVIENRKIVDLPLNNRSPFQLALLSPGVIPAPNYGNAFNTSANFQINGNRGNTSEMLVDGITNSVPAATASRG